MSEQESILKRTYNIINIDFLIFELGKHIGLLVGCSIIMEKMIEFYVNLPSDLKLRTLFTISYMFAIVSVPLALVFYYMKIIWKNYNE